jgi:hypothetical protein
MFAFDPTATSTGASRYAKTKPALSFSRATHIEGGQSELHVEAEPKGVCA